MAGKKNRTLLRAVAEFANALNGVRPLARDGYVTIPLFFLGWPTTELAPWLLGTSLLDALRRAWRGDFAGRRGAAAVALTAASWVLLGIAYRQGLQSAKPLEDALTAELGEDYVTVADSSQPAEEAQRRRRRPVGVLRTYYARRMYVKKAGTAKYGPYRSNTMDVWRRADLPADGKAPVLLFVPGGAWLIGMRRPQGYPLMGYLAARGWVCVAMGYRVSPKHTWPDHIVDVKRAIAWVKENIADFGGDPENVAIAGSSAGGHLASLAALTPDDPSYQPGFEEADTSVVAAVPIYGRYDWYSDDGRGRGQFITFLERLVVKKPIADNRRVFEDASPIRRLRPDAPPFFVLHGTNDVVIPVGEAREFVDAFREVTKAPLAYAELPGAQHAFEIFGSPRGRNSAAAIERFLSWVHATRN